jgi:hypothetical protein
MKLPNFVKVEDELSNKNFAELRRVFFDMYAGAVAKETQATLAVGDNQIAPTVPFPKGRIITFQSAAANLFDKGLDSSGKWVINSSAICTIRLAFF